MTASGPTDSTRPGLAKGLLSFWVRRSPRRPAAGTNLSHEPLAGDVGRDLAALDCLVEQRQHLRSRQRRGEELVGGRDLPIGAGQVHCGARVDDESGHGSPRLGRYVIHGRLTAGTRLSWARGLQQAHGQLIGLPRRPAERPDPVRLERRYEGFVRAS
jgi:hypothetical protein